MPATTPQAEALRADLGTLVTQAGVDLDVVWRQVDSAELAREALRDVLPQLIAVYGSAAATLAADWYDDVRESAAVRGRFLAIPAEVPDDAGADELARWAVGPLFAADPDWSAARSLVDGGFQRRVLNASRATIAGSSLADPQAQGWQRVGNGECAFCDMLIGRGAVYSEASADFASHDHCRCSAVPAWSGQPVPVKPYTPSTRKSSEAERAAVREYLRTH